MRRLRRWLDEEVRLAGIGLVVLVVGGLLAADGLRPGEAGLTELANDLPEPLVDVLRMVMQLGTRPATVVVAIVVAVLADRRRVRVGATVLAAGLLGWALSIAAKDVVERPRPAGFGVAVTVRDDAGGFGYPSGHTTIATASMAAAALATDRRRPTARLVGPVVVGAVVGLGRLAVGVHLPLDVVGGIGLGVATAVAVVVVADR